jgi:catechol 2,3-dioxygenase-like lactoylglutathione lyase family enzyme
MMEQTMQFGPTIPILRMFDVEAARAFYVSFLGFAVGWEHQFGPDFPIYMKISRGDCELHLSEHHGDCSPGAAVRIIVGDVDALCAEITGRHYKYARPSVEEKPWGLREMTVTDPSANRLIFMDARPLT